LVAQEVPSQVERNAPEPGDELALGSVGAQVLVNAAESFLRQVLGVLGVIYHVDH
jgi:hypothetical protein